VIIIERTDADREALFGMDVKPEDLEDDGVDYTGVVVRKPWGHEIQLYKSRAASFWRLSLENGAETSMHCHPGKRTILMVEEGEVILYTLTRQYTLRAGDFVHIEPGAFHRSRAEQGAVIIEVESPPNKQDLVRYSDRYGRQGKGYEGAGS
jgi:mannose-6-phosphate isomerase-like protein (cupin superfamily)